MGVFAIIDFSLKKKKKNRSHGINNRAFSVMGEIKFHELKPYLIVS